MDESHEEEYDDMRGTGGSHGFFETESVNSFDEWSISFQTVNDQPEERWVSQGIMLAG